MKEEHAHLRSSLGRSSLGFLGESTRSDRSRAPSKVGGPTSFVDRRPEAFPGIWVPSIDFYYLSNCCSPGRCSDTSRAVLNWLVGLRGLKSSNCLALSSRPRPGSEVDEIRLSTFFSRCLLSIGFRKVADGRPLNVVGTKCESQNSGSAEPTSGGRLHNLADAPASANFLTD